MTFQFLDTTFFYHTNTRVCISKCVFLLLSGSDASDKWNNNNNKNEHNNNQNDLMQIFVFDGVSARSEYV